MLEEQVINFRLSLEASADSSGLILSPLQLLLSSRENYTKVMPKVQQLQLRMHK
jgi:hypothetical protein